MPDADRNLAIFIDFENLALGFQGRRQRFDIACVLERMVEKGKIVAKKAYADWSRFSHFTHSRHGAAIELIEIPGRAQSGKNSADIRLCVDAMDLAYSKEHINTFVVLSGDSDFSPLVSKLKELGKHVIGLGMQESTSELLRDNCDEFIYYEDLGHSGTLATSIDSHLPETKRKAFALLLESLLALRPLEPGGGGVTHRSAAEKRSHAPRRGGGAPPAVINGINGPGASTGFAAGIPMAEGRPDAAVPSASAGHGAVERAAPGELPPP